MNISLTTMGGRFYIGGLTALTLACICLAVLVAFSFFAKKKPKRFAELGLKSGIIMAAGVVAIVLGHIFIQTGMSTTHRLNANAS